MQQTLFLILATSMWTLGIYFASREGEILAGLNRFTNRIFGDYWSSPFFGCPYCMPTLHSLIVSTAFHLYYGFPVPWLWFVAQWIFIVPSSSFLNYILFNLIRILRGYADLFNESRPCSEVERIEAGLNDTNSTL